MVAAAAECNTDSEDFAEHSDSDNCYQLHHIEAFVHRIEAFDHRIEDSEDSID